MSAIIDYRVATSSRVDDFENKVKNFIAQGFVPHGSISTVTYASEINFSQAMVKRESLQAELARFGLTPPAI